MMLVRRLFYLLCLVTLLPSCSFRLWEFRFSESRFDESCSSHIVSNKALLSLLSQSNISHDGTLKSIVQETQKVWLRPRGKERWEVDEKYAGVKDKLIPLLERVGCIHEVPPRGKKYTYVLFLGATMVRVKKRLDYLVQLFRQGVCFDKIIVLTGQRKLNPELEPINASTETEMIKYFFAHAQMPDEMKKVPVHYVDTPQQKIASGALRRPNTGDTIREWQKTNPPPGSCLVISSQPHVLYQDAVVKTFLSKSFTAETVGEGSRPPYNISIILDALARFLYQKDKRLQK